MAPIQRRFIIGIAAALLVSSMTVAPAHAATGNQGYAVYRDGAVFGLTWHAAFLKDPKWNTTSQPVIHTPGSGYVKLDTWGGFLNGKTYMGTYRPRVLPTSEMRDYFVYTARELKDEQIQYTLLLQVDYVSVPPWDDPFKYWVYPEDIVKIRCDGVVEYIYEWYSFRVFGSDSRWDVTRFNILNKNHHANLNVTPQSQTQYMTRVTTDLP